MLCRKERELLSSPELQNGLRKPAVRAVGAAPGSWSAQTEVRAAGESGPTPTAGGACGCGRGCLLCLREGSYEQTLDLTPVPESSAGPACTSSKVVPALLAPHTGREGKSTDPGQTGSGLTLGLVIAGVATGKTEPFPRAKLRNPPQSRGISGFPAPSSAPRARMPQNWPFSG